jgi:tRNA(Ile)-lysidine synthase
LKKRIEKHNQQKHLFANGDKLLLTISGGIDSMVMLDVMSLFSNEIGLVHCNFHLRGEESNLDEDLVQEIAYKKGLPLYVKSFDTKQFAKENRLSIQMAARELRYNYFDEIAKENGYTKILTAHHLDDHIETFFIHLLRSSGLKGLQGIPVQREKYIRPLLGLTRRDIEQYAEENQIQYREDRSNAETKYLRNQIRHQLSPVLEKVDSQYHQKIQKSLDYIAQSNRFVEREIQKIVEKKEERKGKQKHFPISFLQTHPDALLILHYWLSERGFSDDNLQNIIRNIQTVKVGRFYYSSTHLLVIDRAYLVLSPIREKYNPTTILRSKEGKIERPLSLEWEVFAKDGAFKIEADLSQAFLDFDKIKFPLVLRLWKEGDRFQPLGMKGEKKVSDFLIDNKISRADKQDVFVLVSGGELVWLIGYRVSDRFKITPSTKKILWMQNFR